VVREGETGLLVGIGSARELADAIVRLAANAEFRRSLGEKARQHIAANFSEPTVSANLVKEYCRLLSTGDVSAK
jgi:glycosyltransferase involved in cell wall biosynthesis